jgi:ribosomal protein S12 methylthiotransferase accessory factor
LASAVEPGHVPRGGGGGGYWPDGFLVRLARRSRPQPEKSSPPCSGTSEILVTLRGGRRVDARVGAHVVRTDQPRDNGGEDSAPSPFENFLASIGTCAGIFVQGFCQKRGLPFERIRIVERPTYAADGTLTDLDLDIQVPPDFPEKYRDALVRLTDQCSVKKAIAAQPSFAVRSVVS